MPKFRPVWIDTNKKDGKPGPWKRGWQAIVPKKVEPTLANIKVNKYLKGNVYPVRKVPAADRPAYRDTLARFALACHRSGYGPGGKKGKRQVNSTYRTRAEQEALFAKNMHLVNGKWVPRPGRPLTAAPGTSAHGKGLAIDAPDVRFEHPLVDHARDLGLKDDVASERWHLTNHGFKP